MTGACRCHSGSAGTLGLIAEPAGSSPAAKVRVSYNFPPLISALADNRNVRGLGTNGPDPTNFEAYSLPQCRTSLPECQPTPSMRLSRWLLPLWRRCAPTCQCWFRVALIARPEDTRFCPLQRIEERHMAIHEERIASATAKVRGHMALKPFFLAGSCAAAAVRAVCARTPLQNKGACQTAYPCAGCKGRFATHCDSDAGRHPHGPGAYAPDQPKEGGG